MGLGNFGGVSPANACFRIGDRCRIIRLFITLIKPLNALLLGERYAENLGINIRYVRNWLLVITGLLTAITTAFCGLVAFIGLAVPHSPYGIADSQSQLLVACDYLERWSSSIVCNLICVLPVRQVLYLWNAVTPIIRRRSLSM